MGSNPTLKLIFFFIFLLSLLFSSVDSSFSSSESSSHEAEPNVDPIKEAAATRQHYQVFHIRNTKTFFLDKGELDNINSNGNGKRRKMVKKRRKKIKNFENSRPFSVMLPKGFVPPSGSSPCHNDEPNSKVATYCDFSTSKP